MFHMKLSAMVFRLVVGAGTPCVRNTVQAGKYPAGHMLPGE
jgi:hypothetical protein